MGKTVAQKIFDAHEVACPGAGVRVISLDRVFCHEITTPIAINDLVSIGRDRVFDPEKIKAVIEANSARPVPTWIDVNRDDLSAKIISLPNRDQIEAPVEEQLIVEFYSR